VKHHAFNVWCLCVLKLDLNLEPNFLSLVLHLICCFIEEICDFKFTEVVWVFKCIERHWFWRFHNHSSSLLSLHLHVLCFFCFSFVFSCDLCFVPCWCLMFLCELSCTSCFYWCGCVFKVILMGCF
jgi:hypothetical protein